MRQKHEGSLIITKAAGMQTVLVLLSLSASAFAGEFAVLTTGFRLHAERHESDGATVRLYQKDGGYSQLEASLVAGYESEMDPASPPAPVVEPKPAATPPA